jgi:kinesin family member 15
VPLVDNCLAGFNSSVFAYGQVYFNFHLHHFVSVIILDYYEFSIFVFSIQTGSGKTYTMWGPPNALAVENSSIDQQGGLAPRVFERLFARINEVSINFKFYSLLNPLTTL